jgi:hypothetical protein
MKQRAPQAKAFVHFGLRIYDEVCQQELFTLKTATIANVRSISVAQFLNSKDEGLNLTMRYKETVMRSYGVDFVVTWLQENPVTIIYGLGGAWQDASNVIVKEGEVKQWRLYMRPLQVNSIESRLCRSDLILWRFGTGKQLQLRHHVGVF